MALATEAESFAETISMNGPGAIEAEPAQKLRARTVSGVSWSVFSQVLKQGFTFAISLVVARILGPSIYGLVGMVTVFTNFAALFSELGFGPAIIQRKELEAKHLNAAFWSTVVTGLLLTLLMAGLSPVIAKFYDKPVLAPLSAVVALQFLLSACNVVQIALLTRQMRFRQLAFIDVTATVVAGTLGLCMALKGAGPWSLVAQSLGNAFISVVLAWITSNWRPSFGFQMSACRDLLKFSGYLVGFNIVNYWARNLDALLVGRVIGATALGFYTRAYSLMLLPLSQVSFILGKVMFPALSSIQHDKERVKRAYLKAISLIAFVTFPMMIGLFVVSDSFINALLGEKWAGAIPLLKIFCWVGLLQSITTTLGWVTTSQGRTKLYFYMGAANACMYAISFIVGLHWGTSGVATSYAICNLIMWYPTWRICGNVIGLTFTEMTRNVARTFFCAAGMGAGIGVIEWALAAAVPAWLRLAIIVPLGVGLYLAIVSFVRLDSWKLAKEVIHERLGKFTAIGARFAREN